MMSDELSINYWIELGRDTLKLSGNELLSFAESKFKERMTVENARVEREERKERERIEREERKEIENRKRREERKRENRKRREAS